MKDIAIIGIIIAALLAIVCTAAWQLEGTAFTSKLSRIKHTEEVVVRIEEKLDNLLDKYGVGR